jgi:hypothetical protein
MCRECCEELNPGEEDANRVTDVMAARPRRFRRIRNGCLIRDGVQTLLRGWKPSSSAPGNLQRLEGAFTVLLAGGVQEFQKAASGRTS